MGAGSMTSCGDLADQAIIHTSGALAVLGLVSTSQMMQLGLWPDKGINKLLAQGTEVPGRHPVELWN